MLLLCHFVENQVFFDSICYKFIDVWYTLLLYDTNNIRNGKGTQNKNHQRNNTFEKNQTSDNTKHNKQQAKNQLFSNGTCNLNDDNKTATENTDNGL